MWLSKRITQETPDIEPATLGTVSIGGENAAVVTDGEKRNARIISPGGYQWSPGTADNVLVIRGNELYVPGVLQDGGGLNPGEVMIYAGNTRILLHTDGKVSIVGDVTIDGDLHVTGKITQGG